MKCVVISAGVSLLCGLTTTAVAPFDPKRALNVTVDVFVQSCSVPLFTEVIITLHSSATLPTGAFRKQEQRDNFTPPPTPSLPPTPPPLRCAFENGGGDFRNRGVSAKDFSVRPQDRSKPFLHTTVYENDFREFSKVSRINHCVVMYTSIDAGLS